MFWVDHARADHAQNLNRAFVGIFVISISR